MVSADAGSTRGHWLETRLPPPLLVLTLGLAAWAVARLLPSLSFPLPYRTLLAASLVIAGVTFNLLPKRDYLRAATTVNPLRPDAATQLVTSGLYRFSRHPMYVGHALILLGWGLFLQHAGSLLAVPVFLLYVTRFQIKPEERALAAAFPEAHAEFCRRIRRWL